MADVLTQEEKEKIEFEYTKVRVYLNTLVPKGAMQTKAVFMSIDGDNYSSEFNNGKYKFTAPVVKDDERMIMYSVMLHLNIADSQKYGITKRSVLEDAQEDFIANGNKKMAWTHTKKDGRSMECEAYCYAVWEIQPNDPIFPDPKYVGGIACGNRFKDREMWNFCKNEDWETSIEGEGEVVPFTKGFGIVEALYKTKETAGSISMSDLYFGVL